MRIKEQVGKEALAAAAEVDEKGVEVGMDEVVGYLKEKLGRA